MVSDGSLASWKNAASLPRGKGNETMKHSARLRDGLWPEARSGSEPAGELTDTPAVDRPGDRVVARE